MTNIAPLVNELLKSHESKLVQPHPFSVDNLNAFLREAYQIVCTQMTSKCAVFDQQHRIEA